MIWCIYEGAKLTRDRPVHCQTDHGNGHQELVGHWVDHCPDDGLQVVSSGEIPVDQVGDGSVGEERQGNAVLVLDEEVSDQRGYCQSGECENVGEGVDVFMCWQGDPGEDPGFLRLRSWSSARANRVGNYTYCFGVLSGFWDVVHLRCSLDGVHGEYVIGMVQCLLLGSLDLLVSCFRVGIDSYLNVNKFKCIFEASEQL